MAQFSDLSFSAVEAGFEANYIFDNHFQIHVTAGLLRYTLTEEERENFVTEASADAYNAFDYKIYDGVTLQDDTAWDGGNTKDQITAIMNDVESRAAVYSAE